MNDTSRQLDRIRGHVAEARLQQDVDARKACNEARVAAEGLMRLLASVHEVSFGGKRDKPPTLDVMKRALRHAEVLDRRMEDLVSTVQRYGNRAVHFQADADQEIGGDEAALAVGALEALLPLATDSLGLIHLPIDEPQREPAVTSRDGLPWLAIPLAAVATFAVTWAALQWTTPPPRPPEPTDLLTPVQVTDTEVAPDATPDPIATATPGTPTPVEGIEGFDPPVTPRVGIPPAQITPLSTTPLQRASAAARAHVAIDNADLAVLPCADLTRVRGWLWAEHGYHFEDDLTRSWFTGEGYRDHGLRHSAVSSRFTDEDRDNLNTLNARMRSLDCACPKNMSPRRPCPE